MPVHHCTENGKPGYRWGDHGKFYPYVPGDEKSRKHAKQKAYLQAAAIERSGWSEEQQEVALASMATDRITEQASLQEAVTADLKECVTWRGRKGEAPDKEAGIVKNVKVLGENSGNNRRYPRSTRSRAAALYEGMAVNIDHVDPSTRRSYRDRFGVLRNIRDEEDGLYGDFHYNPKHPLAEQFAWDVVNAPHNVGFSHDAKGRTLQHGSEVIVESIEHVRSVDLVADPATTHGLFESLDPDRSGKLFSGVKTMDWENITLEQLRANRADLVEQILQEDAGRRETADKIKRLEEQLADAKKAETAKIEKLTEELDKFRQERTAVELEEQIKGSLKTAGLDLADEQAVSKTFLTQLRECKDPALRESLIQDRANVVLLSRPRAAAKSGATAVMGPVSASRYLQEAASLGSVPGGSTQERTASWTR